MEEYYNHLIVGLGHCKLFPVSGWVWLCMVQFFYIKKKSGIKPLLIHPFMELTFQPVLWIRIRMDPNHVGKLEPDPHQSEKLDSDPHQSKKQDPDPRSASK